ncbi:Outer membrane receptor protein [Croceitalea dokdonensis DOKDO 023]|uniref:Outer membrane receptor protein n=1 Tax=Croceitalea dokdonensis DOKDO 023 TaxID=1300341 RepID=A0A0P7AK51_9FLAO|nr:TonB-dependent receptor [Croceitalea dokdonensis]KPM32234.1 Outer membrane receptor protein [Croceitalea dokdonensis DOKDO 023]
MIRIFLLLILTAPIQIIAQTNKSTLNGKVMDQNKNPVPFATVYLENTPDNTVTNNNGTFQLTGVEFGEYNLIVSLIGYKTRKIAIEVNQKIVEIGSIGVVEDTEQLDEVIVQGESVKDKMERSAQAVTVLETAEIKLQTADLGLALSRIEGVNVRRSGGLGSQTRFSLNGLTDEQIRFFLDGVPLRLAGYPFGIANVPVNLTNRVDIFKGVVPVRFGSDALGGAVNLNSTQNMKGSRLEASYQTGSFGTHRATFSFNRQKEGSRFFFGANAFYDFTNNNYEIDVEVPDELGRLQPATVERFHDTYEAKGLDVKAGWQFKTDGLVSVRAFANDNEQDIQNNLIMTIPYGEVLSEGANYGAQLRFVKNLSKRLSTNSVLGYTYDETRFLDVSECVYDWFGNCIRERTVPGEIGGPSDQLIWDNVVYGRITFDYQLGTNSKLVFASAITHTTRTGDQRIQADPDAIDPLSAEQRNFAFVNGLEFEWNSTNEKFQNLLFFKDYYQDVKAEQPNLGGNINRDRNSHNIGFGNSFRYRVSERIDLKASYEWATRLPNTQEIFGDGVLIGPNLTLEPERSHNANLEFSYRTTHLNKWNLQFNANGFFREAEHLILLLGTDRIFAYNNVFEARSLGVESGVRTSSPNDRFQFGFNGTFQDFRNISTDGPLAGFNGDRIPNRPYVFFNGNAGYTIPKLFDIDDGLNLFWNARYVNEFFRGWESSGIREFKDTVPEQFIHNAGFTYSFPWQKVKSTFTAEVQNFTDEKAFDFFGVQRPGRAFFFKMNFSI